MVQPTISIRTVTPADIKYKEEAAKVVNAAYRSEGQFVKFLFWHLAMATDALFQIRWLDHWERYCQRRTLHSWYDGKIHFG